MNILRRGLLSRYFEGIAVKRLSVVETTPTKSNQHEFNGTKPLRKLLGDEDRKQIATRFVWLADEQEGISDDGFITWYDSRKAQAHRSAEYRLYYPSNSVSGLMKEGDSLFLATRRDGTALVIVTPAGSTVQNQLLWMFGVDQPELEFQSRDIDEDEARLDFAVRYIFDEIGIEPEEPEVEDLDELVKRFGDKFPSTSEFSQLARDSLRDIRALDDPDTVLMAWVEREEAMFRRLERRVVSDRLKAGFVAKDEADVDGFLSFSLSVQNRRKSRAGQSLENHLAALFTAHKLRFGHGVRTELKKKPDFLFPGGAEYADKKFPAARLTMLGAKSTCKDRWRQVVTEADRIPDKHLLTLEPGISEAQTSEMQSHHLQLVIPANLHDTFRDSQRPQLLTVRDFVKLVTEKQNF